ncbi:carboxylesterase/lipase family protein [Cryobacterium sp. SO2]|uniref:carboxylesterase/lipase family protein n=1 Tax=Cryobacterium sp. SO2 TaxID=1897060 RepID=UPI00223C8CEA|nr:carboxylesterase/lipase family protein [Cryobacterium sp. SO2]WEO77670.1 carboxylesterase/lipase family protein [Cryobacterium sp. SO2]
MRGLSPNPARNGLTRPAPSWPLDVRVTGGLVRGVSNDGILSWRGIPYAAAPVGPLRFRAPQPVRPWPGTRQAGEFGPVAPQDRGTQFKGVDRRTRMGEDCLSVNVQRPADTAPDTSLPVMVFIHGGGYSAGSSQDHSGRGESFVRTGRVIYVSFNYRLGALGYLDFSRFATPARPFESNLGLRDQVAALEWVRDNIRAFGGDPHNVTVFGESAGGNAVITLLATPAAAGLFAQAIAQSPPSNAAYTPELAGRWAAEFVEVLRHSRAPELAGGRRPAAELLAAASWPALVRAALVLQRRTPDVDPGTFCMAPVVDGAFLPERPLDAFRHGRAHPVPLIIGTNDREGSIFRGRVDILPRSTRRIQSLFDSAPPHSHPIMRSVYSALPAAHAEADFSGDYAFWFPSVQVAELHSRVAPVFLYRFDLAPRLMRLLGLDATHGLELLALFGRGTEPRMRTLTALGGRESFLGTGERMRAHWLRFASTGLTGVGWPAYTEGDRLTLIFDEADRVESDPRGERRVAWLQFLPDL